MRGKSIKQRLQEMGNTLNGLSIADTGTASAAVLQQVVNELYSLGDIVLTHELDIADLQKRVIGAERAERTPA